MGGRPEKRDASLRIHRGVVVGLTGRDGVVRFGDETYGCKRQAARNLALVGGPRGVCELLAWSLLQGFRKRATSGTKEVPAWQILTIERLVSLRRVLRGIKQ